MTVVVVALIVALVVIAAVAAWVFWQRRRTQQLQERFGPEYTRVVSREQDRGRAEQELEARQQRVQQLNIRPLAQGEQRRFAEAWHSTQAQFVDDPGGAVSEADRLVGEVLQARGYPVGAFEQRAADISVDHPQVVSHYRTAHTLAGKQARGEASTDDQRQAMLQYRALFEELLGARAAPRTEVRR
jgi:hypothetical protein